VLVGYGTKPLLSLGGSASLLPLGSTFGFPFLVVFFLTFLEEEEKNIVKY
jgi:hypothetical protein